VLIAYAVARGLSQVFGGAIVGGSINLDSLSVGLAVSPVALVILVI
jgi:hypothetical protein